MRLLRSLFALLSLTAGLASHAQQLDLFDPDDFVDPHEIRGRTVFISRLVVGAARGSLDQNRPLGQDVGFVHLANSLYWRGFQFDVKHSETRGENPEPSRETPCFENPGFMAGRQLCTEATFDEGQPPEPGAKNLLQASWYQTLGQRLTLRYRVAYARQDAVPETVAQDAGLKDYDDTRLAQLDAGVRVRGRTLSAYLWFTELTRHSTIDQAKVETITLGAFLPLYRVAGGILTPRLQIAGIADTGPAIDVINPSLDLSWTVPRTDVNVHAIYSPVYGDLGNGSKLNHQVIVYADSAILVLPRRGGRK